MLAKDFEIGTRVKFYMDQNPDGTYGVRSDPDLNPLFKKFESKVEGAGWSASSLYC